MCVIGVLQRCNKVNTEDIQCFKWASFRCQILLKRVYRGIFRGFTRVLQGRYSSAMDVLLG